MEPAVDEDLGLLRRYARDRDEAAFSSLVRRHLDLVYAAAVRRVRDRHLAEDVAQAVFVILARRAASVSTRTGRPLSLWLLSAVRFAAKNALRIQRRRRSHEEEFTRMRGVNAQTTAGAGVGACSSNPTDVLIWHEVAGRLDDAVLKLPAADRNAVLLRFFEDRPVREIALALNVSEDAAKQRVSRAVAKLRQRLGRNGAAGGAVALVAVPELTRLLEMHLVQPAPAGLANACCAAATAGAAAGGAGVLIAKGAMKMMTLAKTKLVAGTTAVALVLGIGGAMTVNRTLAKDARSDASAPAQLALADEPPSAAKSDKDAKPDAEAKKEKPKKGRRFSVANSLPVVVSTVPKAGSTDVDPSVTEIKVTFSKDMIDGNWSWAQVSDETFPKTTGKPHYEADNRTCVLPVKLEPGKCYVLSLNNPPFTSFMDEDGRKAMGYTLVFETKK
jgi:RNA polymerase sigma factor (sigma-70 family)